MSLCLVPRANQAIFTEHPIEGKMSVNYFAKGKVQELQQELVAAIAKKSEQSIKNAMMRIISNMTMGVDMLPLSESVLILGKEQGAISKLFNLYCITYCRQDLKFGKAAMKFITRDLNSTNLLVKAASLRTLSHFPVEDIIDIIQEPLKQALNDSDPYMSKTAAVCVARMFSSSPSVVIEAGLLNYLKELLRNGNPAVVANTLASCMYISEYSIGFKFRVDSAIADRLISCLDECSEWAQIYILEAIMTLEPKDGDEAVNFAERICPRLQHANSGIIMATVRVVLYLSNYSPTVEKLNQLAAKCSSPMGNND